MDYTTTLYRNEDTEAYKVSINVSWGEDEQWHSLTTGTMVHFPEEVTESEIFLLDDAGNEIACPIGALHAELEGEAFDEFCDTNEGRTRYGKRLVDHSFI